MLLDNRDVLAWARGQILQSTGRTRASESDPVRPPAQTTSKHADGQARAPKLGSQLRIDLSADALRDRRNSKTESLP